MSDERRGDLRDSNDLASFLRPLCRRIFDTDLIMSELSWSGVTKDVSDGSVNLTKCSFKQLGNIMSLIRSKPFFVKRNQTCPAKYFVVPFQTLCTTYSKAKKNVGPRTSLLMINLENCYRI